MAVIIPTRISHPYMPDVLIYKWETVTEADTCAEVIIPRWADLSIQTVGTFGGTSIALHGTLDPDGTVAGGAFVALKEPVGAVVIAHIAAEIDAVLENVYKVVPVRTGGASTDVDIFVMGK